MTTQKIALSGLIACLTLSSIALTSTGCSGTRYQRSTGTYLDDKAISTRVKTALFRDSMVSGFDVGVNTFRGEVQLTGFVDTPDQRQRAEQIAREADGVVAVINNLELKAAPAVGAPGSTVGGSSTITGAVPEAPAGDATFNDSTTLQNNLREADRDLDRAADRTEEQLDDAADRLENQADRLDNQPDRLNTQADRALGGSAALAGIGGVDNLQISASNGRATIRGTVASQAQRQEIEQHVRQMPGVQSIDNQLEVRDR